VSSFNYLNQNYKSISNMDQRLRALFNNLGSVVQNHAIFYPTSNSLSYLWGFGFLALIWLVHQIVTGVILVMHYQTDPAQAFDSIVRITNTVPSGWLFRYLHANGASFFLGIVYIHIGRGLYYGSLFAPRTWVWITGMIIFLLMMGTAFIGYVLPWGQMSLWGATVITNLLSALPYGDYLALWIWGGFAVGGATLNRFFSLHYLLPFIVLAMVFAHLYVLHDVGSNNPEGIESWVDTFKSSFHLYFTIKDLAGLFTMLTIFFIIVYFYPNLLGHPDNYVKANPMVTPPHIVPEWYFLPFYAILRSIPHKLGGVLMMGGAIFMPIIYSTYLTCKMWLADVEIKRTVADLQFTKLFFWIFIFNFFLLGVIGGKPVETPYYEVGQISTGFFFLFWAVLPLIMVAENAWINSTAVFKPNNNTFIR
jgi:quinol-cytochrome oxidoreductase complex cytochrome b subunit